MIVTLELVGGPRDGQQLPDYLFDEEHGLPQMLHSYPVEDRPSEVYEVQRDDLASLPAEVVRYMLTPSSARDAGRALSVPESMRPKDLVVRYGLERAVGT